MKSLVRGLVFLALVPAIAADVPTVQINLDDSGASVRLLLVHSRKVTRVVLEQGKRIIITTIQKFPVIVDGIADLSDKRFAVIIDEAHSSQGGASADKMNQAMGGAAEETDGEDTQDKIIKAMQARQAGLMAQGRNEAEENLLLNDPDDASEYISVQMWTDNVINVCQEATYRFLERVVDSIVTMYAEAGAPLTTIHTGGDEVPHGVWEKSPPV